MLFAGCGDMTPIQGLGDAESDRLVRKEIQYDEYGTTTWKYSYDKNGNLVKEICYSYYHEDNGKAKYTKEYSY